jgi:hypothetical protein
MRYLVVVLVVAGAISSVRADPVPETSRQWERPNTVGVLLEFGGGWERVHPGGAMEGVTYRAEFLRFAPQISLNHYLYLGAALQYGRVYSSYGKPDNGIQVPIVLQPTEDSSGNILAPQVFLGVRGMIDIVSGGFEVAPTLRWTNTGTNFEYMTNAVFETTIEFHGRADVWATPHFSAGVMAGMDISSIRDFQAGLQIGFHFEPYDMMTRDR